MLVLMIKRGISKFRVSKTRGKYEELEYSKLSYFSPLLNNNNNNKKLVELDERERVLSNIYVELISSPVVVFAHAGTLEPKVEQEQREEFSRYGIGMKLINSRIFKNVVYDTKYKNAIPLVNGPTFLIYSNSQSNSQSSQSSQSSSDNTNNTNTNNTNEVVKLILKLKKKNLLVIGGKIENGFYGPEELKKYSIETQPKDQILNQLLNTLNYPVHETTRLLQHSSVFLTHNLTQSDSDWSK